MAASHSADAIDDAATTGPETEGRFPPLNVPLGFKATLFACDPLVEYPSAIALGPRPGTLFVVADFMTGLGTEIVRRDEIRLIEDTDGDGYADRATVFADGFNSIEGMTFHAGTVYAMHAPLLTSLRDTDGDGKADERRDIVTGLGLPPEENPVRLHCANGLVMGHDGWLYLALGDHGAIVDRPEGDRLVFEGGGILRCRPDGRDLHVFSYGLRNIYDVALDEDLNVFVRDNENDGGDYKIRVCHSFFGADHGYPYLYYERPDEAMPPLADLGLGSSAGALAYLETQFPTEYRGNLFCCEWGKSVVRYAPRRSGAGFGSVPEIEFATGADTDPYGFKPTDLVVDRDGSLIVADWADGQQPKRGRARIYRIAWGDDPSAATAQDSASLGDLHAQLDSQSYHKRIAAQQEIEAQGDEGLARLGDALKQGKLGVLARLHAAWVIAHAQVADSIDRLFAIAEDDPEPRVRAQALRAIADLTDPMLVEHRLDAGAGDSKIAARLAELVEGDEPSVVLEATVALGRLRWSDAPGWLARSFHSNDPAFAHAAMQTLRRSGNWPVIGELIDGPSESPLRTIALRAAAGRHDPKLVDGLVDRLDSEQHPARRIEYADLLCRVYKRPAPWVYWGYRPAPRPANTVAWERSQAIEDGLDRVLRDGDASIRLAVLRRMQREQVATRLETLASWLAEERQAEPLAAILESLAAHPATEIRGFLDAAVVDRQKPDAIRLAALAQFVAGLDPAGAERLPTIAQSLEDGPVLAESLRQLAARPEVPASPLLLAKLDSRLPDVRAAAIDALAARSDSTSAVAIRRLLDDRDAKVRRAAASAAGILGDREAADPLLGLALNPDARLRRVSLDSLRRLKDARVVPIALAELADGETQTAALSCLLDLGDAEQAVAVIELARHNPSAEVLPLALRALTKWGQASANPEELDRAVAELHGTSGTLVRWRVVAPPVAAGEPPMPADADPDSPGGRVIFGVGAESRVTVAAAAESSKGEWLANSEVSVPDQTPVQFLSASGVPFEVMLNDDQVYSRTETRPFAADSEVFDGVLRPGVNRVAVRLHGSGEAIEFQLRLRRKAESALHEQLAQAALTQTGDPERGRELFLNAQRSQCVKCHRIGETGERIGPELTGVGSRFSRIHLIESILEPSRAIGPAYQPLTIALTDGRLLAGIKLDETQADITLADNQGAKHTIAKTDIEAQQPHTTSVMPQGLEKPLSTAEFVDLIAFLASQTES